MNGAKVVARAWLDPAYRQRLLENGTAAVAELGFTGIEGSEMVILENTDAVPQCGGLHAVFVLSLAGAGFAPDLVQIICLSLTGGAGAACGVYGKWASIYPRRSKFGSGTAIPMFATWCCRCGRRGRRLWTKQA